MGGGKIKKTFSPLLPGVADGPGDPGGVRYLVGRGEPEERLDGVGELGRVGGRTGGVEP